MKAAFMQQAIRLAGESARGTGGPFGAVIVRAGNVIATGANQVTARNDPTAHAEVVAIRAACETLKNFSLAGCELYASCEPCPMCLAAIYWARLDRIFYAATRRDAARAGFDDARLYRELPLPPSRRQLPMKQLLRARALPAFASWKAKASKITY